MRAQTEAHRPTGARALEERDRQRDEVRVDVLLLLVGDGGRLGVGALDEADLRVEREQPLDVGRRSMEVRLEAQPGVRVGLLEALVERDRPLGVVAALHVDPQCPALGAGLVREPAGVGERAFDIEVVAELRELDADLAVDARGPRYRP